jgi:NADP-dependent 3-hydroxy acid dehydrogenase YdfG
MYETPSGSVAMDGRTAAALAGKVAVVTGAGRGIGEAIALALAEHGSRLCLIGRHRDALEAVADSLPRSGSVHVFEADLGEEEAVRSLAARLGRHVAQVDILIHCAGLYARGTLRDAPIEQLDLLYKVNVRGPYLLTQLLLPLLTGSRGQVVFMNSSQGLEATAATGQYAATKHALKAIADSLRQEINPEGVRVLTVFPGRTATPGMEEIYRIEKRPYDPEQLLQPADIAAVLVNALGLPRTAEVTNISIRPFKKSY